MTTNFNTEPMGKAPPQELVDTLLQIEIVLVFCYLCLQEIVGGKIEVVEEGKNFLVQGMRDVFLQADALLEVYPDYELSLRNLAWDIMRVTIVMGVDQWDCSVAMQDVFSALQMLLVI